MSYHDYHQQLALQVATKSQSRFRLGAVVAKRTRTLGVGFNRMDKTHPTMQRNNPDKSWTPGLHAEVHACLGVELTLLQGATIYVARLRKDGRFGLAQPCEICNRFLRGVGIRAVFFTTNTNNWDEVELEN